MKIISSIALILCILSGCEKDRQTRQELPPVTTEGNRTFGCFVNDTLWVPFGTADIFRPALAFQYDPVAKSLELTAIGKALIKKVPPVRGEIFYPWNLQTYKKEADQSILRRRIES